MGSEMCIRDSNNNNNNNNNNSNKQDKQLKICNSGALISLNRIALGHSKYKTHKCNTGAIKFKFKFKFIYFYYLHGQCLFFYRLPSEEKKCKREGVEGSSKP